MIDYLAGDGTKPVVVTGLRWKNDSARFETFEVDGDLFWLFLLFVTFFFVTLLVFTLFWCLLFLLLRAFFVVSRC